MSTLTRVFVILLVLFSIAFSMMTVSVVSRTTSWQENAETYEQEAKIANANLRNLVAASAAQLASARDTNRALRDQIGDLENQVAQRQSEVEGLRGELTQANSEASTVEAINRGLVAQLQVAQSQGQEFLSQRGDLEKRNIDLERRNIDLNDRVNELTANLSVLVQEKRHFEQQINMLKKENERLAMAGRGGGALALESPTGAALPGVRASTPVSGIEIRGRVLEVADGLLTISVGSADGVEEGMLFVIHRDGQYVGDLKVSVVDPGRAAGRIVRSALAPQIDDSITDAGSMTASRG